MQTNLNKLENNIVALELIAEPQEVDEALDHAYKKVVKKVSVPGFRKGKVPRKVLEFHYGKEVLYEEAMEFLVSKGYYTALLENDLEPIDEPKIEIVQAFEDEKPFIFKAEVEVLPEVQLGEYKGLKVEKIVPVVTAEDVEKELQTLRERHAELVAVEKAAVEEGDFAVIDFDGYIDGKAFPGGAGQGFTVEVGAQRFIPGFEEGLVGMAPGSEKEITTTFPEDYHNAELAGKEVVFKAKLHDIKEKELPELTMNSPKVWARRKQWRNYARIPRKNGTAAEHEAKHGFERAVLGEVVKKAQVEVPEKLVERELDHFLHDIEHDLGHRGIKLEEYLSAVQKTEEEFRQNLRAEAEQRVKTDLVLSSIRKAEGISVTDDEVNKRIEETLLYYPEQQRTELRKRMQRPQVAEGIKSSLMREKTIKFLVENAEPVQKEEDSDKVVEAK